jgi:phospholipid/cholesterol/gamma-HCH transport system substrate-binding protein
VNLLRAAEFKVGVLVLSIAALIGYMSLQVSDNPSFLGRNHGAWFLVNDAAGLVKNSAVKMAGIPMGVIRDIRLQDGIARVEITVRPDVVLHTSAAVTLKSQGILGDSHVELSPGSAQDPPLANDGQILIVHDKGNLDAVITQVGDIASNLKDVAKVLKDSVSGDGSREHILGRIVQNIEKITKDVSDVTSENKGKISEIIDQLHGVTGTLNEALNDDSEEGFKETWKRTLVHVDNSMKNLDEITGKINRGEGTIGKLISDEDTAENVSNAVEGISGMLDTASKVSTGIDVRSGYMDSAGGAMTSINLKIQPGIDRYYLLGVTDDPMGVTETTTTVDTGTTAGNYTEKKTYMNRMKINAEFAKTFYDFTIRGGVIQSSGGIGLDYSMFGNRLMFSLDMFNFSNLNLQPVVKFNVWKTAYLFAGMNDALDKSGNSSSYIGAGIYITNDDLKLLLTKSPF